MVEALAAPLRVHGADGVASMAWRQLMFELRWFGIGM